MPITLTDSDISYLEPKVRYIAERYWHRRKRIYELDDVVQEGLLHLVGAAARFDETRNVKFWTYAERRVVGAIKDMYARNGRFRYTHEQFDVTEDEIPDLQPVEQKLMDSLDCCQVLRTTTGPRLTEREQTVLTRRFWGDEDLRQIGDDLQLHYSRIGQIRNEAIAKIQVWAAAA